VFSAPQNCLGEVVKRKVPANAGNRILAGSYYKTSTLYKKMDFVYVRPCNSDVRHEGFRDTCCLYLNDKDESKTFLRNWYQSTKLHVLLHRRE
jgi:cystathionine beta-lyase family protein involved in aluminum resistance